MKIVINALSARLGGGQTYLKNLFAHLPADPYLDIILYAQESLQVPEDGRIRRLKTHWPTENPILRTVWEKLVLPRVLANEKVQVLFCPGGVVTSRTPVGCKTVTMFRNMTPFDPIALARIPFGFQKVRNLLLKRIMLQSMAAADLTIFISRHAQQLIEALVPVRNPIMIPHGIGPAFRTYGKDIQRPAWLPDGEFLLYVSRFDSYKHQYEVAFAFTQLPNEYLNRFKLVFVGEAANEMASRVLELARTSKLESSIVVVGPIDYADLPGAYHHATANLFASSCENCPNILLEALGAGRPVLSSNVMPMPEFGAGAVEYFTPTDPKSICNALVRVLEDDERSKELAELAALRSADFDWARTSRATWEQIASLVKV